MIRLVVAVAMLAQLSAVIAAPRGETVTTHGLGPAKFGMTVTQFGRALKEPMSVPKDPDDRGCFYLETKKFPGVAFMFEDGYLRRIDIGTDKITTSNGVGVGTSISVAKLRYGSRLEEEPHFYGGPADRYLTVALSSTIAVRFETSGANIDNFYVGYKEQVKYVEGCL